MEKKAVGYKGERDTSYTDIEKAKELLAQAGYPDGFDVELEVGDYEAGGTKLTDLAQLIASDLSKVGINASINIETSAVAVDRYVAGVQGFALWLWTPDYYDLNNQLAFSPNGKCGALASWTVETEEDQALYDLCQQIISELDPEARAAESAQFQDALADGSPFWCLCQHPRIVAFGTEAHKGMSIIMITHDLGIVSDICDKVIVVYLGQIVEAASVRELFSQPLHPYTKGLIEALPRLGDSDKRLTAIEGSVPSPEEIPLGCAFHPRCKETCDRCRKETPPEFYKNNHMVRCWLYEAGGHQ